VTKAAAKSGVDRAAHIRAALTQAGHELTGFTDAVVVTDYRATPDSAFMTVIHRVIFSHRTVDPMGPKTIKEGYSHDLIFVRQNGLWTLSSEREKAHPDTQIDPGHSRPTTVPPTKPGKGTPINRDHRKTGFLPGPGGTEGTAYTSLANSFRVKTWTQGPAAVYEEARVGRAMSGTYDAYTAATYAYRWNNATGGGRNPAYPYFSSDDCTNFVSQVAEAGGWQYVRSPTGDVYADNYWWFGSASDYSHSWSVSNNFYWWMYYSGRGVFATSNSQALQGDMIQFDWNGDNIVDHSMVITIAGSSDLYLTGHSNDLADEPLSAILARNPTTTQYWIFLMYSAY
jgi:hypothetical protein